MQTENLVINRDVYDAMLTAARKASPLEACGLLGGKHGQATEFYELTNADASGEHYSMILEEQFAAIKGIRAKGIEMLAIWHSHPASLAQMSEEDLRLAYTPDIVYVILSLADAERPQIRGFVVNDGRPEETAIRIREATPSNIASGSEVT